MHSPLIFAFAIFNAVTLSSPLVRRDESLCDDDQDNIIRQFLLDGALLANSTLNSKLEDGTSFRQSTAFSNYFEDCDYDIVSAMYGNINDYYFSPTNSLNIWLVCAQPEQNPEACSNVTNLVAFADPDPTAYTWDASQWFPSSGFGFCNSFFDPQQEASHVHYYQRTDAEWCSGTSVKDFWTSGYFSMTLFAMTDMMGSLARLPLRNFDHSIPGLYPRNHTHAAIWLAGNPSWAKARELKQQWGNLRNNSRPTYQRVQSAASYAAAATEWFFLVTCGKSKDYSIPA